MTNHTTDLEEAEASAAVEVEIAQTMDKVSNSDNDNDSTKLEKKSAKNSSFFSWFNPILIGGLAVMGFVTFTIAVFSSLKAADRVTMMASQQEAATYSKATKAPKAGKTGGGGCAWPLDTTLCDETNPLFETIFFDVCPSEEVAGGAGTEVGSRSGLGGTAAIVLLYYTSATEVIKNDYFIDDANNQYILLESGDVQVNYSSGSTKQRKFSASDCPTTTVPPP
jgi:hypothetical protein